MSSLRQLARALVLEWARDLDHDRCRRCSGLDVERQVEPPDLMSFSPENVSSSSWSTSVLESAACSRRRRSRPAGRRRARRREGEERARTHGKRVAAHPRRNFEPSIGILGVMRTACCLFGSVQPRRRRAGLRRTTCSSSARTERVARTRRPRCRPTKMPRPPARARSRRAARRTKKKHRARWRASSSGCATPARSRADDYTARRAAYDDVKRRAAHAHRHRAGPRCARCSRTVEDIAARRQLTPAGSRRCG